MRVNMKVEDGAIVEGGGIGARAVAFLFLLVSLSLVFLRYSHATIDGLGEKYMALLRFV